MKMKIEVLKMLAELFPTMTIKELYDMTANK